MQTFRRKAIFLLAIHAVCCVAFLLVRTPQTARLEEMDRRWRDQGEMFVSSGAPLTYIADRPLNNWSTFHGGESAWVKALVLLNGPPLIFSSGAVERLFPRSSPFHEASWRRAEVFAVASILWWVLVAFIWQRANEWSNSSAVTPN